MKLMCLVGVTLGASILASCAESGQNVRARGDAAYFQSMTAPDTREAVKQSEPFMWNRVDARLQGSVDALSIELGNWVRTSGQSVDAGPVLHQLASALEDMPHDLGSKAVTATTSIRTLGDVVDRASVTEPQRRLAVRQALSLAAAQLTEDASGAYVADPKVAHAVAELRRLASDISEDGPDSQVERGLVAARDAIRACEFAIAGGLVTLPSDLRDHASGAA